MKRRGPACVPRWHPGGGRPAILGDQSGRQDYPDAGCVIDAAILFYLNCRRRLRTRSAKRRCRAR
jgi:hypothetical protein